MACEHPELLFKRGSEFTPDLQHSLILVGVPLGAQPRAWRTQPTAHDWHLAGEQGRLHRREPLACGYYEQGRLNLTLHSHENPEVQNKFEKVNENSGSPSQSLPKDSSGFSKHSSASASQGCNCVHVRLAHRDSDRASSACTGSGLRRLGAEVSTSCTRLKLSPRGATINIKAIFQSGIVSSNSPSLGGLGFLFRKTKDLWVQMDRERREVDVRIIKHYVFCTRSRLGL